MISGAEAKASAWSEDSCLGDSVVGNGTTDQIIVWIEEFKGRGSESVVVDGFREGGVDGTADGDSSGIVGWIGRGNGGASGVGSVSGDIGGRACLEEGIVGALDEVGGVGDRIAASGNGSESFIRRTERNHGLDKIGCPRSDIDGEGKLAIGPGDIAEGRAIAAIEPLQQLATRDDWNATGEGRGNSGV